MNAFGISERSYKRILRVIASYPEIEKAVVFGSRAKGDYQPGSDIDLALFGKGCTPELALEVEARLNETEPIPYHIDVVDFNTLTNPKLAEHITRVGVNLYERSTSTPSS